MFQRSTHSHWKIGRRLISLVDRQRSAPIRRLGPLPLPCFLHIFVSLSTRATGIKEEPKIFLLLCLSAIVYVIFLESGSVKTLCYCKFSLPQDFFARAVSSVFVSDFRRFLSIVRVFQTVKWWFQVHDCVWVTINELKNKWELNENVLESEAIWWTIGINYLELEKGLFLCIGRCAKFYFSSVHKCTGCNFSDT